MCDNPCARSPGPGAYLLPSTIGYNLHDPSRLRNPQYSMGGTLGKGKCGGSPGPGYDVANVTRYGKSTPPAYSIKSRLPGASPFSTPGPGTYVLNGGKKTPAYSMSYRTGESTRCTTPGPNQYSTPTTIGPKVPDKTSAAAYSLSGFRNYAGRCDSPGPANYGETPVEIYRNKAPKYSMHDRVGLRGCDGTPGPASYLPKEIKCSGGYSFGSRVCTSPYITADDVTPCVVRRRNP